MTAPDDQLLKAIQEIGMRCAIEDMLGGQPGSLAWRNIQSQVTSDQPLIKPEFLSSGGKPTTIKKSSAVGMSTLLAK